MHFSNNITEPTCCTCPTANPFTPILNSFTWIRSHYQRFCFSQLLSLISCMPVISCMILLCSPADWAIPHKREYPYHIQSITDKKNTKNN